MSVVAFIGTFDPLHGAHIGQLLRAYRYAPFSKAAILVNKHPLHKPNAASWQHRVKMAELTLDAFRPPFAYSVAAVDSPEAPELAEAIDCKVTGIDSLLDNLSDPQRWSFAQRWPMVVLSVPGIEEAELNRAIAALPAEVRKTLRYEYVSEKAVPMMNYDFTQKSFVSRRIHATQVRAGKEDTLIPLVVRDYIQKHGLHKKAEE